ncbi:MAG: nucleotidyltransferase domain-containing protein [Candidatus Pacebacteria bacterium]|nr:nucleotidyltransferase domain-containing protein [Candidatus Paceibacterota bacterium]
MEKLEVTLDKIEKLCNPVSIFLYGSRARNDFLERSDFEIGVLMHEYNYISRGKIASEINGNNFNIYPFKYEDFLKGKIDTPFQKSIYLYELVGAGKTLRGEKVLEKIKLPAITIVDLIQSIRFEIGYSLASIMSQRNGDFKTASLEFYKSCLFGLRCLEILELKKLAFTYEDIYNLSKKINLGEYDDLVSTAHSLRLRGGNCEDKYIFQNISFLNDFIESRLVERFKNSSDERLI